MDNFDLKKYLAEGKLYEAESNEILSQNLIQKYYKIFSPSKDTESLSKINSFISNSLPQNPNISYKELTDQFGEELAFTIQKILFGAYIDGQNDKIDNLQLVKDYLTDINSMM